MLSDSPEAVRARRYRENKKRHADARHVSGTSSSTGAQHADEGVRPVELGAKASSSSSPLHETRPFTGAGPQAFARPLVLAGEGGRVETVIPPASEPPRPPPTPEEVAGIAIAVAAYFEAGTFALIARHADELGKVVDIRGLVEKMPLAKEFVRASAERVAIKYGIRIPYQDEIVVVGAIGVATFGFFGPKKKQTDKQTAASGAAGEQPKPGRSPSATAAASSSKSPGAAAPGSNSPPASSGTDPLPDVGGDFAL